MFAYDCPKIASANTSNLENHLAPQIMRLMTRIYKCIFTHSWALPTVNTLSITIYCRKVNMYSEFFFFCQPLLTARTAHCVTSRWLFGLLRVGRFWPSPSSNQTLCSWIAVKQFSHDTRTVVIDTSADPPQVVRRSRAAAEFF